MLCLLCDFCASQPLNVQTLQTFQPNASTSACVPQMFFQSGKTSAVTSPQKLIKYYFRKKVDQLKQQPFLWQLFLQGILCFAGTVLQVHFILRVSADAKIKHVEIAAAGVYGCYILTVHLQVKQEW